MEAYAGIDLHSSNSYIGIIDEHDRRHFSKRLPNSLTQILVALEPFKKDLKAVVVESTYSIICLSPFLFRKRRANDCRSCSIQCFQRAVSGNRRRSIPESAVGVSHALMKNYP